MKCIKDACRSVAAVRHGSRIWLSCAAAGDDVTPTDDPFLPTWVIHGPSSPGSFSSGITTTKTRLSTNRSTICSWQFMIGYYYQCQKV